MQSALFIGADPAQCQGVVGFGRYPLFPTNYTGREARTQQDYRTDQHQLLEVSATYPAALDAPHFSTRFERPCPDASVRSPPGATTRAG